MRWAAVIFCTSPRSIAVGLTQGIAQDLWNIAAGCWHAPIRCDARHVFLAIPHSTCVATTPDFGRSIILASGTFVSDERWACCAFSAPPDSGRVCYRGTEHMSAEPASRRRPLQKAIHTRDFRRSLGRTCRLGRSVEGESGFFERLLRAPMAAKSRGRRRDGTGFHAIQLARAGLSRSSPPTARRRWWPRPRPTPRSTAITLEGHRLCRVAEAAPSGSARKAFDAIICLGNSLTHLFDHETRRDAVDAMYRALKPGGVIVIDHRNYDRMLDKGYSTKHSYYYTGGSVHVAPAVLNPHALPHGLQVRERPGLLPGHVPAAQEVRDLPAGGRGLRQRLHLRRLRRPLPRRTWTSSSRSPTGRPREMERTMHGEDEADNDDDAVTSIVDQTKAYYERPGRPDLSRDLGREHPHRHLRPARRAAQGRDGPVEPSTWPRGAGLKPGASVLDVGLRLWRAGAVPGRALWRERGWPPTSPNASWNAGPGADEGRGPRRQGRVRLGPTSMPCPYERRPVRLLLVAGGIPARRRQEQGAGRGATGC